MTTFNLYCCICCSKITEDKLRETFSQKGIITDVQLKYTKDGKFRHFAFVGYQNEEEAKAAQDFFDNTFLNSVRIKVEKCSELGKYYLLSISTY